MYEDPSASLTSVANNTAGDVSAPAPAVNRDVMMRQLHADNPVLRMQAARAFCDIEEPRAVAALIELLDDACPLARVSAAYALGRNTSPDAIEPLMTALDRDWNGYVRKGVVWALGNAKDSRALAALGRALSGDISAVRLWAASALGQIGGAEAIAPLVQGLASDPVAAVRSNCAWALGQLLPISDLETGVQHSRALNALIAAMTDDGDEGVQDDARAALEKLNDPAGLAAIAEWEAERY